MNNDILRQVIEVEKEIQHRLEQEKESVQQWLEQQKKTIEEEYKKEEKKITESFEQAREVVERDVRAGSSDIVGQATERAERFRRLTDDALLRIVAKHIDTILPG